MSSKMKKCALEGCGEKFAPKRRTQKFCCLLHGREAVTRSQCKNGGGVLREDKREDKFSIIKELGGMIDRVKKSASPFHINYKAINKIGLEEVAVLNLSDIHAGVKNSILNPETGKTEITYSLDIMIKEFSYLLESMRHIMHLLAPAYKIKKLVIFGLGDWVTGDQIFRGQKWFIEFGVGKQIVTLSEVMTHFLKELLGFFEEIELVLIGGNHGRMTLGREAAPATNSNDYLVYKMLEAIFSAEKRVKFIIPESMFYVYKIYDWKYLLHHGNTIFGWMGLPYYGIVRQSKSAQIEMPHHIECIAHFHVRMEIPVSSRTYTLVNGGWVPRDAYAWESFRTLSKPEQYFFGVSSKRPRTWSFSLDLEKPRQFLEASR